MAAQIVTAFCVLCALVEGTAWAVAPTQLRHLGACVLPASEQHLGAPTLLDRRGAISVGQLEDDNDDLLVFACDSTDRRLRQITTDFDVSGQESGVQVVRIGASTVAVVFFSGDYDGEGDGGGDFTMTGLDVATGRRFGTGLGDDMSSIDHDSEDDVFLLHGVFVGPGGAVAWLSSQSQAINDTTVGSTVWTVRVADTHGVRTEASIVQSTPSPPLSELRISRRAVTFDDQGVPTSLPVGSL